jgi:predicted metal-dependent hydrolase
MDLVRRYLAGYPEHVQLQAQGLIDNDKLTDYLQARYPQTHAIKNDSALRQYVLEIKSQYIKKSAPLSKIAFDSKIHVIKNALGTHTYVKRVQGSKIKSKNEIHISAIFKQAPGMFLNMIVVHELAHIKEKEHDKSFYQLCRHMLPDYHQIEFDCRLYLISCELSSN